MSFQVEIKSTVKNGFPVLVEAGFIAYDDGLEIDYLDLYTPTGKKADWLNPPQEDLDRLEEECRERLIAAANDAAEYAAEMKAESKKFWGDY